MILASKDARKRIALERIYRLFELAEKAFSEKPERSRRYVELARKVGTRNRATIPAELKKQFCKKCGTFLKQGKNAQWTEKGSIIEITCKECGFSFKKAK